MTIGRIPVWLDCDPGHDDTVAILLALHHKDFELVGVSTTYGNASLVHTTYNALSMLTIFQKDLDKKVPVYSGSSSPLKKEPHYAPGIHGANGLGGIVLPTPAYQSSNEIGEEDIMIDALYAATQKYRGELAVVPVGPLTNVAKLFQKYPEARENIKVLSIMGGGIHLGNIGDGAEFNIFDDPTAAHGIFTDPILAPKTILVPLDVTHTVLCSEEIQERILQDGKSAMRTIVHDLMTFFAETYKSQQDGFSVGPPVHDPVAVYVLLEEYGVENVGVKYERYKLTCIEEGPQEGKINYKPDSNGTKVVFNIDVNKFWEDLLVVLDAADTP